MEITSINRNFHKIRNPYEITSISHFLLWNPVPNGITGYEVLLEALAKRQSAQMLLMLGEEQQVPQ